MISPSSQAQPTHDITNARRAALSTGRPSVERSAVAQLADSRSPVGAASQMTVDECIEVASRECFDAPCQRVAECDFAGECLAFAESDADVWIIEVPGRSS